MLSITLKQLEIFVSVAETKSFSKTAQLMSFSQPVVSSNISLLEDILQIELLDRTNKKKVEITEEGHLFYKKAKDILASCYTLQDMSTNKQDDDTVTIGANIIPARYMLTDVMSYYRKERAATRFLLREDEDSDIVNLLEQRKIDLGIVSKPIDDQRLKNLPIFDDQIVLGLPYTPRNQCLLMKKPSLYDILTREEFVWNQDLEDVANEYLKHLGLCKNDLNIIVEMSSEQLSKNAVIDGLGISFLSKISLKCAIKSAEILTFDLPEAPKRTITVVYNPKVTLNRAGKDFVDFLNKGSFDFEKCYR